MDVVFICVNVIFTLDNCDTYKFIREYVSSNRDLEFEFKILV
jgi:hypothetical protein